VALQLAGLEPNVRAAAQWALDWAAYFHVPVTVTSTRRTWAEQSELYATYLAGKSLYPANQPGDSAHEFGLAWDSVVPDEFFPWWTYLRRLAGFEVFDTDRIHAQVPNWRQYR
jgi:hypothetical protein